MKKSQLAKWFGIGLCSMMFLSIVVSTFAVFTLADNQQVVAADDDDDDDGGDVGARSESVLAWTFRSLGPLYSIVFLAISFTFVALAFKYFMDLRRDQNIPPGMAEQFEAMLQERKFQEAYEMTKNDESYLGQVLSAGLAKLSAGYDKALTAMQETSDHISMGFEAGLSYIGLIAGTSTMIGLLGTVSGMIASFSVIANSSTAPKPNELANGISTAMFTTLVGLIIAIPATAVFQVLKNKLAAIIFDVGMISEDLLGKVLAAAQQKPQK